MPGACHRIDNTSRRTADGLYPVPWNYGSKLAKVTITTEDEPTDPYWIDAAWPEELTKGTWNYFQIRGYHDKPNALVSLTWPTTTCRSWSVDFRTNALAIKYNFTYS